MTEPSGTVGLVSHSGSTWSGLIGNQRDLVFNYAISAGQEMATTMADYVEFLLTSPETRVIAMPHGDRARARALPGRH